MKNNKNNNIYRCVCVCVVLGGGRRTEECILVGTDYNESVPNILEKFRI
jgi:hypothetical protein